MYSILCTAAHTILEYVYAVTMSEISEKKVEL
jgi:hypothetical protein